MRATPYLIEGLGHLSTFLVDDASGTAAVVDPRRDVDVYLDAVFFPLISEDTFRQEGWHYEADGTQMPLAYKGVVFNEMKGDWSSPDALMHKTAQQALYPDTTYGKSSGGDPVNIGTGYTLWGDKVTGGNSPAYSAPIAAGACIDGKYQAFADAMWDWNAKHMTTGYYDGEIQLLSMLVASGNWWTTV